MHSLRAQVLALVIGVGVVTLTLLAYVGTRTARVQFRATVAKSREINGPPLHGALDSLLTARGMPAVVQWVESLPAESAPAGMSRVVVVDLRGAVLASSDSVLRGRQGVRESTTRFRFEVETADGLQVMLVDGAEPLGIVGRDTAAMVFRLPATEGVGLTVEETEGVDGATRRFSAAFDRAIWLGVLALVLGAGLLARMVTGRLLDPLRRLTSAAQRIAGGDYLSRVGPMAVTEFGELASSFDRMAESLQRSESARRQLMRDVAHELRTPLTNLKAQVEALQDGMRPADASSLTSLQEEVALLERLVADVDVLARADAGRLEIHPEAVDLGDLVQRTANAFVAAGRLSVAQLTVLDAEGIVLPGDPHRLGQVLRNLLENAVQHGGEGVQVSVAARLDGQWGEITVTDNGPGIAAQHLSRIFDRLYRPDTSRTRASGGAGLGLAIVKVIVEAHNGTVALTSVKEQGTTVLVRLPLAAH